MSKEVEKFLKELEEKLTVKNIDGFELKHKKIRVEIEPKNIEGYRVTLFTNIIGDWGGFSIPFKSIEEIKEYIKNDLMYREKVRKEREDKNE